MFSDRREFLDSIGFTEIRPNPEWIAQLRDSNILRPTNPDYQIQNLTHDYHIEKYYRKYQLVNIYHVRNIVNVYYYVIAENIAEHLNLIMKNIYLVTQFVDYILGDPELCEKYYFIIQYAILNQRRFESRILQCLIYKIPYEILVEKYPPFMLDPDCKYITYQNQESNENFDMPYLKSYTERIESCRKHEKLVRAVAEYTWSSEKIDPFYNESIDVIIHMKEFVNQFPYLPYIQILIQRKLINHQLNLFVYMQIMRILICYLFNDKQIIDQYNNYHGIDFQTTHFFTKKQQKLLNIWVYADDEDEDAFPRELDSEDEDEHEDDRDFGLSSDFDMADYFPHLFNFKLVTILKTCMNTEQKISKINHILETIGSDHQLISNTMKIFTFPEFIKEFQKPEFINEFRKHIKLHDYPLRKILSDYEQLINLVKPTEKKRMQKLICRGILYWVNKGMNDHEIDQFVVKKMKKFNKLISSYNIAKMMFSKI